MASVTGLFFFGGIRPGDYKIFALQGLPQGFEQDPAVLARYENRGCAITVASGQTISNMQVEWIQNAK
jgi:hypothetical protein